MKEQNEENLKELFEKFLDSEQAEQAAEDIRKAEQILCEYPVPEPDDALVADIKANIAEQLQGSKANAFKWAVYKAVAVAAVFIFLSVVGVKLFEQGGGEPERVVYASIIPNAIWESDDITADDADLATLTAEIEQIESEILTLQLSENGDNGSKELTELEMELIEICSDFWKG